MSAVSVTLGDTSCVVQSLTDPTTLTCDVGYPAGGLQDLYVTVEGQGKLNNRAIGAENKFFEKFYFDFEISAWYARHRRIQFIIIIVIIITNIIIVIIITIINIIITIITIRWRAPLADTSQRGAIGQQRYARLSGHSRGR